MTWRNPSTGKRAPGYAVLPAETEEGEAVNARQAAALYWWTVERDPRHQGRHFGIYRTRDAAHAAVPLLACHDTAAPASSADDEVMLAEGWNEAKGSKSRHGGGSSSGKSGKRGD
jgi:hypothetical protein